MSQISLRWTLAALVAAVLLTPSCGFKRQLVSITITPSEADITGVGVEVQFKAVGNYVHPPDSRDITDSVEWESAAPQIVTIDQTGLATSADGCGKVVITATAHRDPHDNNSGIVVGNAIVNVSCVN